MLPYAPGHGRGFDALEAQGLVVQQYYPESGPGQHELSVSPADGVAAADHQLLVRQTVHGVAARHGLRATFVPKPFPEFAGSGCHLHLSLWREGRNAFYAPDDPLRLSPLAYRFIGGLLHHLPALMAVTTPSVNSCRRLQPGMWAGA